MDEGALGGFKPMFLEGDWQGSASAESGLVLRSATGAVPLPRTSARGSPPTSARHLGPIGRLAGDRRSPAGSPAAGSPRALLRDTRSPAANDSTPTLLPNSSSHLAFAPDSGHSSVDTGRELRGPIASPAFSMQSKVRLGELAQRVRSQRAAQGAKDTGLLDSTPANRGSEGSLAQGDPDWSKPSAGPQAMVGGGGAGRPPTFSPRPVPPQIVPPAAPVQYPQYSPRESPVPFFRPIARPSPLSASPAQSGTRSVRPLNSPVTVPHRTTPR